MLRDPLGFVQGFAKGKENVTVRGRICTKHQDPDKLLA
jgi:hypothetical protein